MIRLIFLIFFSVICCEDRRFYIGKITPEKNKPVIIPQDAGHLYFQNIVGTLYLDFFSQLNATNLELNLNADLVEPGAVCSPPSLKSLSLSFDESPITLTKEILKNCGKLDELWISARQLTETDADSFQNLTNLTSFSSENVKIQHVTKDTFKNSLLLENLHLCRGEVSQVDLDAFNHFQRLKTVEICLLNDRSDNTQQLFANTIKTDKLTLTGLSGNLFLPQFKEVRELFLNFERLEEIDSGICASPWLKKLFLRFIPGENFVFKEDAFKCENLEELVLTGTSLYPPIHLPEEVFQKLPQLRVLHLNWLTFKLLKREFFKNLSSLERLSLYHCSINEITGDAFDDLVNLRVLEISRTRELKHFSGSLFAKNVKLGTLKLASNGISHLTWDEFKGLTLLRVLDISDNPIRSFDAEKIALNVPNLRNFNINAIFKDRGEYKRFTEELKKKLNVTFDCDPLL